MERKTCQSLIPRTLISENDNTCSRKSTYSVLFICYNVGFDNSDIGLFTMPNNYIPTITA